VSPILVRPVREQFEHDRVIRVLQGRYRRKYEVVINPGAEQNASVDVGSIAMFPDLVLFSQERGRKLQGTIEVETTESVNTLEALAQWAQFSRLRAPFYLYVPPNSIDAVRRLCTEHQVVAAEIWTYHMAADQVRFTMVHRSHEAPPAEPVRTSPPKSETTGTKVAKQPATGTRQSATARTEKKAPARAAKPVKKVATNPAKSAKTKTARAAKKASPKAKATRTTKSTKATKSTKPARRR
jgi:hypothetical protein